MFSKLIRHLDLPNRVDVLHGHGISSASARLTAPRMGVATGNSNLVDVAPPILHDSNPSKQLAIDQEQSRSLVVCDQTSGGDYLTYLARATNDAVRDWDVRSGKLFWRQGLPTLFGYEAQLAAEHISFWDERLHPSDQGRITKSIGEAFSSDTEHWSGEYRFRCLD